MSKPALKAVPEINDAPFTKSRPIEYGQSLMGIQFHRHDLGCPEDSHYHARNVLRSACATMHVYSVIRGEGRDEDGSLLASCSVDEEAVLAGIELLVNLGSQLCEHAEELRMQRWEAERASPAREAS